MEGADIVTLKVDECIHPDRVSCRGCEHSFNPSLFDGGCKLHYGCAVDNTDKTSVEHKNNA